jgi:predicted HicB family RNase H-like nuclease
MKYKGYRGYIKYDDDAKIFHGEVLGLKKDVITFQGESIQELEYSFKDSVDDYLNFCKERGESPDKPYSGRFNLRISPELHERLELAAKMNNDSLNSFVSHVLEKVV